MYRIAKMPEVERRTLFRNTSQKMNLHEAIIEKDFWVCLTLDYLFHQCEYKEMFAFKGGTSLSKAYDLIHRFSEDIDLILDWRLLKYRIDEPWEKRSNTKQDKFNKDANIRAEIFLKEELLKKLKCGLSEAIDTEADLFIDTENLQTINFNYPNIFSSQTILQTIRLEIGALSAWTPAKKQTITPYLAEQYPAVFINPQTDILTVAPERTFWEKVTILHHEAHRPKNSLMPQRYSRHYYDLYCFAKTPYKQQGFDNLHLLQQVVEFKMKFYPRGWAKYQEAKLGTLKLLPPKHNIKLLREDYISMSDMMYGTYPDFDEMMDGIAILEQEINLLTV